MDRLRLQEEAEHGCGAGQGGLQPEDVAPGAERYDDAADKWAWVESVYSPNVGDVGRIYLGQVRSGFQIGTIQVLWRARSAMVLVVVYGEMLRGYLLQDAVV